MIRTNRNIPLFLIVSFSCGLIFACGSGDGGGGGTTGIEYTGKTTQAPITATNAVDISTSMFQGSSAISGFGGLNKSNSEDGNLNRSQLILLSDVFKKIVSEEVISPIHQKPGVRLKTETETIPGECGGEVTLTVNIDEADGTFDGGFEFKEFCENNATFSGSGSVSGQVKDEDEGTFKFSFGVMNVTSGSESYSFSGDVSVNLNGSSSTITMNFFLKDNRAEKVFWVKDFTISAEEGSNFVDIRISGRFYHPDEGFVDIQTDEEFRIFGNDLFPSSGSAVANGDNQTQARLVAVSSTKFRVTADTTGDGIDDFDSGELNWSDL